MTADAVRVRLRPDIGVVIREADTGAPSVLLHDPVTESFDRVAWPESDIVLALREATDPEAILETFRTRTTIAPTLQDIHDYLDELDRRGLLAGWRGKRKNFQGRRRRGLFRTLAGLLFIQVPLAYPAEFLRRTAPLARLVLNPFVTLSLLLAGLAGLVLALPRFDEYWRDSFGNIRLDTILFPLAAIIISKTVHEFAHAYQATIAGSRVKSMGVAFFFGAPFPFTDVTDAWRLPWRERLRVASAGLWAELALAGGALLLWNLSPPGDGKIAMARLSSIALLSTVLTNLNPGPRFDGYYILTCILRTENLRSASLALLRRHVYGRLFGLAKEPGDGDNRRSGPRIFYAVYSIVYRMLLGGGFVLMAYHFLPKAFGIPLALAVAALFFALPAMGEAVLLWRRRTRMRMTAWLFPAVALFLAAGIWFFGEWPRRIHFPAVTRVDHEEAVRTRRDGVVSQVLAERGGMVLAGDILVRLVSRTDEPVIATASWALREAELSEEQSWLGGEGYRQEAANRAAETARRREQLAAARERERFLDVPAPVSGRLVRWDESIAPGVHVGGGNAIGWIASGDSVWLSCYPEMSVIGRLQPEAPVRFVPDSGGKPVTGRIVRIDSFRPEVLEDAALAPVLGAVANAGVLYLPTPYAKVLVQLDEPQDRVGQTGRVYAETRPESLAARTILWLRNLAVRESAF